MFRILEKKVNFASIVGDQIGLLATYLMENFLAADQPKRGDKVERF